MKTLVTISVLFVIGGSAGWLLELFYRRLAHGKWINPGFLTGPCLPLYGSGVLVLYFFSSIDMSFIKNSTLRSIFAIAVLTVLLTIIEFITGIVFTEKFNVKLWDYSKRPGNIKGVICPLFSVIWGAIGAAYYLFIHKYMAAAVSWISENEIYTYFLGMYIGVLIVDVAYSFKVVTKIRSWAKESGLVVRYEALKYSIHSRAEELKKKRHFVFPFAHGAELLEQLEQYKKHFENLRKNK